MARVFSGIQPSGELHLGNYLGAIRQYVEWQGPDAVYCVVDLHAMTAHENAAGLADRTLETMAGLVAAGLEPDVCTLFVQSQVPQHTQMAWLMECTASFGELSRMTQFKDKSDRREFVSVALFSYPALQAADVLLYDTEVVPVGDDQRQHIELARDLAIRFNGRFGDTLVVPRHEIPAGAARVMDLQEPTAKMSKSSDTSTGCVLLFEDLASVERKIKRAVTDSDDEVRYDREQKPGIANLLDILGSAVGRPAAELAGEYQRYGSLKTDTAEAVVELLRPIQQRRAEVLADPGELQRMIAVGGEKAEAFAAGVYQRARDAVGFLT